MNGAYWRGHMTIGGLPSPHSLIGFLRYFRNVSQRWPVSWMAPTCSICQEMVSVFFAIKNIFKEKAVVFKLQAIYSTVTT